MVSSSIIINKLTMKIATKKYSSAFTIVELMVVISVIAVLATIVTLSASTIQKSTRDSARNSQTRIIANSLEKYYRDNGEYPSVAAMTNTDVSALKQKLGISNATVFKLPLSSAATNTSLAASSPSTTKLVYSANTTDPTKNTQCQTDANGYCDGFTLAYVEEATSATKTIQSTHATFQAVKTDCDPGDTQSGNTCTHTYAGTYQAGTYTCPSGGTLSGTTCTRTYAASYSPASSGYYCPSGGTLSGTTCTTSSSYPATYTSGGGYYYCPNTANGEVLSGTTCVGSTTYAASTSYTCPSGYVNAGSDCVNSYSMPLGSKCPVGADVFTGPSNIVCTLHASKIPTYVCTVGDSLNGSTCTHTTSYAAIYDTYPGTYSCPSGGSLSGSTCYTSGSYTATYYSSAAYYYCSGSDTLSGTTCTNTYTATQGAGYYICPSGGTASGSTCSYTYQLQN